jgi:hypothetical protein
VLEPIQQGAPGGRVYRPVCYRCFKPKVACICALIEPVANRTGIIILQHPHERSHAVGTVRILRLGLRQVRVEPCTPWADGSALQALLPARTALLYPGTAARDLELLPMAERPRHLVILDGTWLHAKQIYRTQRWLGDLPHVRLTPTEPSRYRIRAEPRADYVSTLEAVVHALRILEPNTRGLDGLLRSFSAMIDWQAAYTARGGRLG